MNRTTLTTRGLAAVIAFTATSALTRIAKGKDTSNSGEHHNHSTKIPVPVEYIGKKIHKQQARLVGTVAKKNLGRAHDHALVNRSLVKTLPGKVAPGRKAAAEAGSKEVKLAKDIDKSGATLAQQATEANVKKTG